MKPPGACGQKHFYTMTVPWWAVSKLADRTWKCQQTRINQDAYLCKMWYVKLVAQNCTYFSAAQKKLSQKAKNWIWKVINLDGLISSCSNQGVVSKHISYQLSVQHLTLSLLLSFSKNFQTKISKKWTKIEINCFFRSLLGSNTILTFSMQIQTMDYILSPRYMQELIQIGMRGILLSPSPF